MNKAKSYLDKLAKEFLEENTEFFKWKKITFSDHLDAEDKQGIDGWIHWDLGNLDDKIPFSLRNRKINRYYGIDALSWTYTWINGEPGEWFYGKDKLRIHLWTNDDNKIVKIIIAETNSTYRSNKTDLDGKLNGTNGQSFVLITIETLFNEMKENNLLCAEYDVDLMGNITLKRSV